MRSILLIGLAGMAGTIARYLLSTAIDQAVARPFPWGTLAVNVVGCLLAGVVIGGRGWAPESQIIAVAGFLGGFTTFSAFGVQTVLMSRSGEIFPALAYVALSNVVGVAAAWAGILVGQRMPG